jgi:hypothetical protein
MLKEPVPSVIPNRPRPQRLSLRQAVLGSALAALGSGPAQADEGGVSFWLPGQFASFTAVPEDPGWSLGAAFYRSEVSASISRNFLVSGNLTAGLDARASLLFLAPTYAFKEPVAGAQAAVSMVVALGRVDVGANVVLTVPGTGGQVSVRRNESSSGISDLYPTGTLKWKDGNHHVLAYAMAGLPVGDYKKGRLANIGINHYALDGGGGYTYLDEVKGHELSVTGGLTYNFENKDTQYKNGVNAHIDWAASQFLSERIHVGLAGYVYQQLSADSGAGANLGPFKSRVYAAGPEVGYFFPYGKTQGYVQFKAYKEWGAQYRPSGHNVWLSLLLPLGP